MREVAGGWGGTGDGGGGGWGGDGGGRGGTGGGYDGKGRGGGGHVCGGRGWLADAQALRNLDTATWGPLLKRMCVAICVVHCLPVGGLWEMPP